MKDNKLNIYIIFLSIVSLFVGYGVYRSISDTGESLLNPVGEDTLATQEDVLPDTRAIPLDAVSGISGTGDGIFEVLPTGNELSRSEILVADAPDVNRPVVILASISPETQSIAEEKIASLAKELATNPESYNSWLELAAYRKVIGDFFGAIEIWEFLTRQWNGNIAYKNLGMTYHYDLPDYPRAESYLKQAIEKDQSYIPSYIELFNLYRFSYADKSEEADDALLSGLEQNPGNILLLSTLGDYYADIGDVENSRRYYENAITEAQKNGDDALIKQLSARIDTLSL
ncbi:MAG: hypothetical protein COW88_00265 [Candidatus Lloydbacteria bacterium CG22_combo_CG10-13_8_21_14_all_47_15]|uniref:Uncharacterized protein n=1 Tax=Candidatus Lloydbacteria bacterium CG22_combo_CG10-13_8_21_14_all_47_15 TaxID=1974635 RepID=A0A2H0CVW8_9BACT|nr:MAG: hypothetical protein COW88_00265 [Candidatus Lloydbacteria bacterium CG22_combo_CG10-13_8_21_14_all_47_15]